MCILLATRNHPDYDLIVISNRDEYFERNTHSTCWHNNGFILSPFDMTDGLYFPDTGIYGTWTGINRNGRLCTILNLKLENENKIRSKNSVKTRSRGMIPFKYLENENNEDFSTCWNNYDHFNENYHYLEKSGDFNFFYGDIKSQTYKIIDSLGNTFDVLNDEEGPMMVISNDIYKKCKDNDISEWNKIKLGKLKLTELVEETKKNSDISDVFDKCLQIASYCSVDCLDLNTVKDPSVTSNTIFVPPLKSLPQQDVGLTKSGGSYYGTRSQIVTVVSKDRKTVTVSERILHTSDKDLNLFSPSNPKEIKTYSFQLS